jgi:3,4-dihydroxy 2-butanone 4-phosphate synthase/GTP cyclohydrolase II
MMEIEKMESALADLRQGKMIILVDDEDRENEGDLVIAAEKVTPEAINFMARHGRGLICLSLTEERADHLDLPLMVSENSATFGTAFTVSIEARHGVTTGISAADRSRTIQTAIADLSTANDLARPGHVFPLRAKCGGVLVRAGQTEGSVDLARLAGLKPAGVICEIMNDDGTMSRMPQLREFGLKHGLKIVTIADLVAYRMQKESLVRRVAETVVDTAEFGEFKVVAYENEVDQVEHLALVKGEVHPEKPLLVRVHSECLTGDVFGSRRCDCGEQLNVAMARIAEEGCGVILYLRQEGRGIGLLNKLKAYALQDQGYDTVEANHALGFKADTRGYGLGAQILVNLGIRQMRLMTNNPGKMIGLQGFGLDIIERVPIQIVPNQANIQYLKTKQKRMGHLLEILQKAN